MSDEVCKLVTRRRFVTGLGSAMLLVACSGRSVSVFRPDPTSAPVTTSTTLPSGSIGPPTDRTLVVVEMGGGNDGLNTIVPLGNDAYAKARPSIGIKDRLHTLDDQFALNPGMQPFKELFDDGKLQP